MSHMLLTAYNGAILGPIAKLLGWIMNGIYYLMSLIGIENVGLSIIIFTFVIHLFMFPLTYKQQKFSKLSQKMQPEIQAIQKKYSGKKDQESMMAMQQETQEVYQKYGVSMMGTCVQLLIQMPLLFSLYRVFMNVPAYVSEVKDKFSALVSGIMASSGYQEIMTQFTEDLNIYTQPAADFTVTDKTVLANHIVDVLYSMNSAGWDRLQEIFPSLTDVIVSTSEAVSHVNTFIVFNISDTPWHIIKTNFSNHNYVMVFAAVLIPVISYLTQVLNIKMMPQAATNQNASGSSNGDAMAQQMKMMNQIMPLFSLVMCFTVSVGLGIYWIAGAVFRAIQQFFLNKHFEKMDLEDIISKNQEKAKKKREKMGITEKQISNAAKINTKKIDDNAGKVPMTSDEKESQLEKAREAKSHAKPGSMAAKANMVRDFNEKNSRK